MKSEKGRIRRLEIFAVPGIAEVRVGDDIGALVVAAMAEAGEAWCQGDIISVAQKVVSKAEGRTRRLADIQATFALGVHAAGEQSAFQLEAAARDVARLGRVDQFELRHCRQVLAVLGHLAPRGIARQAPTQPARNQARGLGAGCGQAAFDEQLVCAHVEDVPADQ